MTAEFCVESLKGIYHSVDMRRWEDNTKTDRKEIRLGGVVLDASSVFLRTSVSKAVPLHAMEELGGEEV
jgi:hypothetical protein